MASNIEADSLSTEPVSMFFFVYGFGSETEARQAFPKVVSYLEDRADRLAAEIAEDVEDFEHKRISIGQLGDEREAYYAEPIEGAHDLLVVVRVGPDILYVRSLALAGSSDEFVASYLETFLAGATDDPMSLVPDISDLPVGWELDKPVWAGDILDIITTPGISATPAA